jgi:hypothetical protein
LRGALPPVDLPGRGQHDERWTLMADDEIRAKPSDELGGGDGEVSAGQSGQRGAQNNTYGQFAWCEP